MPHRVFWKLFGAFSAVVLLTIGFVGVVGEHRLGPREILWVLLPSLLVSGGLSRLLARSTTRPLRRAITTMADQVEHRLKDLEFQRHQAQAILESLAEGVFALDREGRVLWLNSSAQRLFDMPPTRVEGKRLVELLRPAGLEDLIQDVLTHGRPAVREVHLFSPQEQAVRFQATPCEGGEGGAALVLAAQDVTEIRRLEGIRREFVANVSHELKTPLTSIKGLVETLLGGALEDPGHNRRFVSLIDEDAQRLSRLIDDLLELSQIESKAAPLRLQPVRLSGLIEELAPAFQPQLQKHQVTLDLAMPPQTPQVQGNPERLRQVFVNLIDNAIKFNKPGGRIMIAARRVGPSLEITVEDTGVGIPEQDVPRIFERFYRVDKARSRELGGTGLGLAIVKHLVDLHRGTVSVRSRPGHGCVFTLTLPLA